MAPRPNKREEADALDRMRHEAYGHWTDSERHRLFSCGVASSKSGCSRLSLRLRQRSSSAQDHGDTWPGRRRRPNWAC